MELKLIMSGTPKGESQWAPKEEYSYIGTLYTKSNVNRHFEIRLRNNGNGNYAYYHYLIYNIVSDYDGRPGGYLGLTLRFDSYCPDYKSVYSVLDMVYRKLIVGNIVKNVGGGRIQYICLSFEQKDSLLKQIESSIMTMLSPILSQADISKIQSIPNSNNLISLNINDASPQDVLNAITRTGCCSLSAEYLSTLVESQMKKRYEEGRQSRQNEINILSQRLKDASESIKTKDAEISSLQKKSNITGRGSVNMGAGSNEYQGYNRLEKPNRSPGAGSTSLTIISLISVIAILYILFFKLPGLSDKIDNIGSKGISDNAQEQVVDDPKPDVKTLLGQKPTTKGQIDVANINEDKSMTSEKSYEISLVGFEGCEGLSLIAEGADVVDKGDDKYMVTPKSSFAEVDLVVTRLNHNTNKYENLASRKIKIR